MVGVERAVQVALHQVVEVEGGLAGPGQVGGQCGVAGDAVDRPAADGQRVDRRLELVADLGRGRVGEPRGQRRLVVGIGADRRRPPRPRRRPRPAPGRVHIAAVRRPGAADDQPDPAGAACASSQARTARPAPAGRRPPRSPRCSGSCAGTKVSNSRSRSTRNCRSSKMRCTASRSYGWTARSVPGPSVERHVADQLGEPAVHQHVRQVPRAARRRPCPGPRRPGRPASSRLPNSRIHLAAVFSPTPGMPGRLSHGSPRSAAKSGYCAGVSPYLASTSSGREPGQVGHPLRG